MVAQDALDLLAAEAPEDPEKVHEALWQDLGLFSGLVQVQQRELQPRSRL
jgi:hypothetical protein